MKHSVWLLFFVSVVAHAQTACPKLFGHDRKKDGKRIVTPIKINTSIQGGLSQSFLYSNSGANLNGNYKFVSAPKIYAGFTLNAPLSNHWQLFAGAQFAANKEGLLFNYNQDGDKIFERIYNTSILFRFPLGIFYQASAHWKIGLSQVILFSTYFEDQSTGTYDLNPATTINGYDYAWHIPDNYDTWYLASDFLIEYRIRKKIAAQLTFSMDYAHAVQAQGEATIQYSGGQERYFHGSLNPHLCYLAVGLSYTLSRKYQPED